MKKERAINQTLQPIMLSDGGVLGAADSAGSMKTVGDGDGEIKISKQDRERYVDTGMVRLVNIDEPTPPAASEPTDAAKKGGK